MPSYLQPLVTFLGLFTATQAHDKVHSRSKRSDPSPSTDMAGRGLADQYALPAGAPGVWEGLTVATVNVRYDGRSSQPVPIPPTGSIDFLPYQLDPSRFPTGPNGQPLISEDGFQPKYDKFDWNERPWAERRSRLVDCLGAATGDGPDVVGFQEVLETQMHDLQALLGEGYAHVGVGRDDGHTKGEYSPLFYKKSRFEEVSYTYKWLSETPTVVGSVGWDASQTRIATILTLRPRSSPSTHSSAHSSSSSPSQSHSNPPPLLHIINTHYDDQGVKARAESSLLLRREVRRWVESLEIGYGSGGEKGLVLLMGDFNSPSNEDGYQNMISPNPLPSNKPSFNFIDAITLLQVRNSHGPASHSSRLMPSIPYGPNGTYTGFTRPGAEVDERIDFVFLAVDEDGEGSERKKGKSEEEMEEGRVAAVEGPKVRGGWKVNRHVVMDNLIAGRGDANGWTGRWSDHRAVIVTIGKF